MLNTGRQHTALLATLGGLVPKAWDLQNEQEEHAEEGELNLTVESELDDLELADEMFELELSSELVEVSP